MLLSDAICYVLLTITITATCVSGESTQRELTERKSERRNKREAAVLIDSFPLTTYKVKPDLIYKRVSKVRYRRPTSKYGPPRAKYSPSQKRPVKKYRRKQVRPKKFNKRAPKPNYGTYHRPSYYGRPKARPPPQAPQPYHAPEPAGFGEPPKDFTPEYVQPPKQSYGEPPVDSYGEPLKLNTALSTAEPFGETPNYENFGQHYQSYQSYQQDLNVDNINSYSNYHPTFTKPETGYFDEEHQPKYADSNLNSYADVYQQSAVNDFSPTFGKPILSAHAHSIRKNRPWKSKVENEAAAHDHIVVGGQYAEPPGRLVPNFQPSAPMNTGDDEFAPPHNYLDSELAASAAISPYVNYKNSNMAFSPQNLNDAFSIY